VIDLHMDLLNIMWKLFRKASIEIEKCKLQ